MANRTKFTPRARKQFLAALAETANVTASAASIHISRRRMYELRDEDDKLAAEWDDAIEQATDSLEAEARRRAKDGVLEPVFYQGKKVASVARYSDHLLEQLLKAHRPEKFRERYDVNVKGALTLEQAVAESAKPRPKL